LLEIFNKIYRSVWLKTLSLFGIDSIQFLLSGTYFLARTSYRCTPYHTAKAPPYPPFYDSTSVVTIFTAIAVCSSITYQTSNSNQMPSRPQRLPCSLAKANNPPHLHRSSSCGCNCSHSEGCSGAQYLLFTVIGEDSDRIR
jgi:hypothetical protein